MPASTSPRATRARPFRASERSARGAGQLEAALVRVEGPGRVELVAGGDAEPLERRDALLVGEQLDEAQPRHGPRAARQRAMTGIERFGVCVGLHGGIFADRAA